MIHCISSKWLATILVINVDVHRKKEPTNFKKLKLNVTKNGAEDKFKAK